MNMDVLIVIMSALAGGLSFISFAWPLLQRVERKERYRAVIQQRRKTLFQQTKDETAQNSLKLSARESIAILFKVRQMLGQMGEKVRIRMLRAGIRNPAAPVKFIAVRCLLPLLFMGLAMLFISHSEKAVSNGLTMIILLGTAWAGYKIPDLFLQNIIQRRAIEVNQTFPDALDMMLICVQGGIGLEQAIDRISAEMAENTPVLAEELGILSAEMAILNDRREALQDFAKRMNSSVGRSFAMTLIQAEQYGTSVSQALRVMADELRDQRMAEAERKAASLPPKLTVPMILFFLPVLFVIILGPSVLQFLMIRHH